MRRTITAAWCGLALMSACAMAQTGADYLDMTLVHVRPDKGKEYEDAVKKLAEVQRKFKGDRWLALSGEYADFGELVFSSSRPDLAAIETGMGAFQKALKEGMGPLGDKLMRDLYAWSASGRNEIRHRRWDLSVHPPSSAADLIAMVAHTRWIRALRVDLKPGRAREYAEAWKPVQAEFEKLDPPVTILVSESVTGTPAMYFAGYLKSLAEMDAMAAGVQKVVASGAYMDYMRTVQSAAAQSTWEILRVRPDLSNPPDEVVSADPAFWKPKPAPAAAAKPKPETAAAAKQ